MTLSDKFKTYTSQKSNKVTFSQKVKNLEYEDYLWSVVQPKETVSLDFRTTPVRRTKVEKIDGVVIRHFVKCTTISF